MNALLFGVDQDRYEAIVRLLLSLRKPQLSQTLDPQELSARLTEALPELERDAVLRVSGRLDQLDHLRAEAAELREVRSAVSAFIRTYRDWARAALHERGERLRDADRARRQRAEALERAQWEVAHAAERRAALAQRRTELDHRLAAARGAERELRASEDWRAAERLEELRRQAEAAERTASRAHADLERSECEARELCDAAERARAAVDQQQTVVAELLDRRAGAGALAGVTNHAAAVEALVEEGRVARRAWRVCSTQLAADPGRDDRRDGRADAQLRVGRAGPTTPRGSAFEDGRGAPARAPGRASGCGRAPRRGARRPARTARGVAQPASSAFRSTRRSPTSWRG